MTNDRTECFNYDFNSCSCNILDRSNCLGCSFYTDRKSSVKKRIAAQKRLQQLPLNMQAHIAQKYYNGIAVWNIDSNGRMMI